MPTRHARRARTSMPLLAVTFTCTVVLAACGGAATPAPSGGPSASPTDGSAGDPTTQPSAQPSTTSVPGATPSSAPSEPATPSLTPAPSGTPVPIGKVDHPTDPEAVVLRMESGGGFVPFGFLATQAPAFTLYGDNSVIFRPTTDPSGTGLPPFWRAVLNADQVDALLTYALGPGHLADARESYVDSQVADAPTTLFTVDAGGTTKQVSVYALGIGTGRGGDASDYAAFTKLADLLGDFEAQVRKGQVESADVYQPASYRGVLHEGGKPQGIIDWPWDDLSPDDFVVDPTRGYGIAELTPEQVAKVAEVPSGGDYGIALQTPDGTEYTLMIRPLLPGDSLQPEPPAA